MDEKVLICGRGGYDEGMETKSALLASPAVRTFAVAALVVAVLLVLASMNVVGIYNGLNKGVFVGSCGLEVVGEPGFFCNVD